MSTVAKADRPLRDRLEPRVVILLTVVWVLFWGTFSPMSFAGGLLLSVLVLAVFPLPPLLLGITPRPWSLLVLVARFFADMVVASIQVAYQAAAPWFHPHGYLVDVALRTDDDLFAMITAEMVALVPGTVVVDVLPSERRILLHIFDATEDDLPRIAEGVRAQEERVLRALAKDADRILAKEQ